MTGQDRTGAGDTGRPQRVLVIDTATSAVVTGVVEMSSDGDATALAERIVADQRRHAEILTSLMRDVLADAGVTGADLDAVVVGCGPGPFTGLRVGMATGSAYADALGIPAYGVCTLDAIDGAAPVAGPGARLVLTDARRREVYWALYDGGRRIAGPGVDAPDTLVATLADTALIAVLGESRFTERFGFTGAELVTPTAAALAAVAAEQVRDGAPAEPLSPLYLRRPDAVELKDQKRKSLLPAASDDVGRSVR
ncbi:tRNA (adenosine(37)-N6)-threonylcarbamoyltransferase complex dimerization subunit type 1 TsaB [Gordonia hydrophobica]|uniref:tRNA (Adenosine(37)-N6)-threonylcarbamoyltransferase complex dimerization subunit type 1 TsaB n=1 Tax=Gordonia hydrophobica TaxID=40516 RepID=A0ABZ2U1Y6_9ACTN|nr:tRNA (adenosine(37)-N6)-threonylcarbamoyltransferase complex dimerization subunit type 1 TsaB [Gordonia hydrophobica]MBM7366774.1 tRNA threonylcarbamoyl adenosine modification protein YeaZ [Gordonia hydrophobica]